MALILYKNNIQLDDTTYQPARMMFALILYKNNIQPFVMESRTTIVPALILYKNNIQQK